MNINANHIRGAAAKSIHWSKINTEGLYIGVVEASQLGWQPGFCPMTVDVTSARTGDTMRFYRYAVSEGGVFKYESMSLDIELHVLNS